MELKIYMNNPDYGEEFNRILRYFEMVKDDILKIENKWAKAKDKQLSEAVKKRRALRRILMKGIRNN